MNVRFDPDVDALTLTLSDRPVHRTVEVGDGRLVDLAEDGTVVAIEVLGASRGVEIDDIAQRFHLVDVLTPWIRELWRGEWLRVDYSAWGFDTPEEAYGRYLDRWTRALREQTPSWADNHKSERTPR